MIVDLCGTERSNYTGVWSARAFGLIDETLLKKRIIYFSDNELRKSNH